MSRIHGRRGRLYVGLASDSATAEPVSYLNSWTIEFDVDRVEVTAFEDSNKTYVSGLPDASGTFDGFYDTASDQLYTAAVDGMARKFYLYPTTADTTVYFYGTASFDFSVDGSTDDAVTVSGSWAASGPILKN
jgi:hypothetical protein